MTDYYYIGTDAKKTLKYIQQLKQVVKRGKEAYFRLGCVLGTLRLNKEYCGYGKWEKFAKDTIGSPTTANNYIHLATDILVDSGIIKLNETPNPNHFIQGLTLIDQNPAILQDLLEAVDLNSIRRVKPEVIINTGSLADLEPQYARLLGESKKRTQYCRRWNISELLDSLDLLGRFGTESNALQEHIINEWLDTESEQNKRPLNIADFELEPAELAV